MTDPGTVVNTNDNVESRNWFFKECDPQGPQARFKQYIPRVTKLIERYSSGAWKISPFSWEYCFKEFQLCTLFEQWPDDRAKRVHLFALALKCSPMVLHNDPERLV